MTRVISIVFMSAICLFVACKHEDSLQKKLVNKKWQVVFIDSTLKPENVLIKDMDESMQYLFEFKSDSLFIREREGVKDTSQYYIKDSTIYFKNNDEAFLKSGIKKLEDDSLAIELFEVVYHFREVNNNVNR